MKTLFLALSASLLSVAAASPSRPEIRTSDVDRFYAVYEAAGGRPTAEQLQRDYLDKGSTGLLEFARVRNITGVRMAAAMADKPALFVKARECAAILPRVEARLSAALHRLTQLYPEAHLPPVTIAVGRGRPVGTANAKGGVMIGLEALCELDILNPDVEDRFVHIIAHEYAHVQQPASEREDGNETVLEAALAEGSAELVAELISGSVGYVRHAPAARGREKALETQFLADQDQKALGSDWLYNGIGTAERPGDLGYWVGYRITKAYYSRAVDKQAALQAILEMRDPKAFLAGSGWQPGMDLE